MHYSYESLKKYITDKSNFKEYIESEFEKQESLELNSLLTDLNDFKSWKGSKIPRERVECFFSFFQDAILGAYYRYLQSKEKAWSWKRNIVWFVCGALLPILATAVSQFITGNIHEVSDYVEITVVCILGVLWIFSHIYTEFQKNRSYRETWVRHSACYGRLHLALSSFLVSKQSDDDYEALIDNTISLLQWNFEQFVTLAPNGLAEKSDND